MKPHGIISRFINSQPGRPINKAKHFLMDSATTETKGVDSNKSQLAMFPRNGGSVDLAFQNY